jgi:hypothetical protein
MAGIGYPAPVRQPGAVPARREALGPTTLRPSTQLPRQPKLLDRLREALWSRHYSPRTEQTYCHWVKRFIFFHHVRHPAEMAEPEINIRTIQELLGHKDVNTTMIYTHVLNKGGLGVRSPVDALQGLARRVRRKTISNPSRSHPVWELSETAGPARIRHGGVRLAGSDIWGTRLKVDSVFASLNMTCCKQKNWLYYYCHEA